MPEEIVQKGMELDLAEVNRVSMSDNNHGKRLMAFPGTQGTGLATRRRSQYLRIGRGWDLTRLASAVKLCLPRVSTTMLKTVI